MSPVAIFWICVGLVALIVIAAGWLVWDFAAEYFRELAALRATGDSLQRSVARRLPQTQQDKRDELRRFANRSHFDGHAPAKVAAADMRLEVRS